MWRGSSAIMETDAGPGRHLAELGGEGGPGDRVMAGDEAVAALGGDPLELADLLLAHLGPGPDPAAHRHLALDVLGQVGRVEGEHETSAADRAVQADHETLMAAIG